MGEEAKEEKHIHCFAYMDKAGRILIPLRNREEAGIAGIAGADCEVNLVVRKVYEKKEEGEEK
jgi:DNA-binding transcriptional regulator/RsmH inhibitor MraZ